SPSLIRAFSSSACCFVIRPVEKALSTWSSAAAFAASCSFAVEMPRCCASESTNADGPVPDPDDASAAPPASTATTTPATTSVLRLTNLRTAPPCSTATSWQANLRNREEVRRAGLSLLRWPGRRLDARRVEGPARVGPADGDTITRVVAEQQRGQLRIRPHGLPVQTGDQAAGDDARAVCG